MNEVTGIIAIIILIIVLLIVLIKTIKKEIEKNKEEILLFFKSPLKIIITLVWIFIFYVLPILGMYNCDGWNEGTGQVKSCIIDNGFTRGYADFYYALMLISAFMMLIPLVIYLIITANFIKFIVKQINSD